MSLQHPLSIKLSANMYLIRRWFQNFSLLSILEGMVQSSVINIQLFFRDKSNSKHWSVFIKLIFHPLTLISIVSAHIRRSVQFYEVFLKHLKVDGKPGKNLASFLEVRKYFTIKSDISRILKTRRSIQNVFWLTKRNVFSFLFEISENFEKNSMWVYKEFGVITILQGLF